jgi:hypothetical protein
MKKDQNNSNVGYFLTKELKDGRLSTVPISNKEYVLIEFQKALNTLKDGEKIVVKATENFYLGSQNNQ